MVYIPLVVVGRCWSLLVAIGRDCRRSYVPHHPRACASGRSGESRDTPWHTSRRSLLVVVGRYWSRLSSLLQVAPTDDDATPPAAPAPRVGAARAATCRGMHPVGRCWSFSVATFVAPTGRSYAVKRGEAERPEPRPRNASMRPRSQLCRASRSPATAASPICRKLTLARVLHLERKARTQTACSIVVPLARCVTDVMVTGLEGFCRDSLREFCRGQARAPCDGQHIQAQRGSFTIYRVACLHLEYGLVLD